MFSMVRALTIRRTPKLSDTVRPLLARVPQRVDQSLTIIVLGKLIWKRFPGLSLTHRTRPPIESKCVFIFFLNDY